MAKENRKNIPEKKKKERNQHDTSADNILKNEPEGRHFNENVEPRHPRPNPEMESDPDAHLGAEEIDDDRAMSSLNDHHSTTGITAPEIRQDVSEEEEEAFEEIKRDMTGG